MWLVRILEGKSDCGMGARSREGEATLPTVRVPDDFSTARSLAWTRLCVALCGDEHPSEGRVPSLAFAPRQ